MQIRLLLQKTDKKKMEENPKLPYFRLVLPPEEDGGEWVDVGAFWKAKSGDGYSGSLKEGITIDVTGIVKYVPKTNKEKTDD